MAPYAAPETTALILLVAVEPSAIAVKIKQIFKSILFFIGFLEMSKWRSIKYVQLDAIIMNRIKRINSISVSYNTVGFCPFMLGRNCLG